MDLNIEFWLSTVTGGLEIFPENTKAGKRLSQGAGLVKVYLYHAQIL
jgi:hypothetical protein